jgi:2-amino-4-hydroxy-6-hydroxymethyldihydropteridine diphosphokinase
MPTCLIALGSNLGDRHETLQRAVRLLGEQSGVDRLNPSRWHETIPVGGPAGQDGFLNGALIIETSEPPERLIKILQQVEGQCGRQRRERWGPRSLDLDLLLYGDLILESAPLTLPHPRMAWRRFVLEPAAEVAASMIHPTIGWSIRGLLDHLNTALPYVAVTGPPGVGKAQLVQRLGQRLSCNVVLDSAAQSNERRWEAVRHAAVSATADRPLISDFWLGESAVDFPEDHGGEGTTEPSAQQTGQSSLRPKLVVFLDAQAPLNDCDDLETWQLLRRHLLARVRRPGVGPLLKLQANTPDLAIEEILAAVESMK